MKKTIKVEYQEQSKAVVANTKIEVEAENEEEVNKINAQEVLKEANELYNKAAEFSETKTKRKALQWGKTDGTELRNSEYKERYERV